jgi:Protein of unknown function (DUF3300)
MKSKLGKKILSAALCAPLIALTTPIDASAAMNSQTTEAPQSTSDYSGQGAPQTPAELQALVAPIALYPDALVAQILSASTFPDQVAVADNWLQTNKTLTGSALSQAVDKQSWDPSVKALTQFPSVLHKMAQSLAWTSSLGEAYHSQQADVMTAIQALRAQAKKAGNLKSGSQITVVQQSPQTIVIQPTNPQVVYVPEYNPAIVYGYPYVTPGYSTGALIATGLLSFGAGMAVGAMMSGGCCGWGYSSWNCDWHGGAVYYHGGAYYGNSAWHGGYYGGGYNNAYHNNYNNAYHNTNYNNSAYHNNNYNSHSGNATNISGNTVNVNKSGSGGASSWGGDKSGGWGDAASSHGWGQSGSGRGSSAFSGFGGGSGGGWQSRSASARGWGSRGGGGGWGGGSFGGGGFRGGGRR